MRVRTKFKVDSVIERVDGTQVQLSVVTSGSPENDQYFNYTPYGNIVLGLLSPETGKAFVTGKEVYVDFTPVVEEENAQDTIHG
jgi:hypothetical protein